MPHYLLLDALKQAAAIPLDTKVNNQIFKASVDSFLLYDINIFSALHILPLFSNTIKAKCSYYANIDK